MTAASTPKGMRYAHGERLILLPEVIRRTGIPRATIYEMMRDGLFPKPVQLTARRVAWVESEIDQHIRNLIAKRDEDKKAA
jgi:prophage regulatory protein